MQTADLQTMPEELLYRVMADVARRHDVFRIDEFYKDTKEALKSANLEVRHITIYVNDGSDDGKEIY